MSSPSASLRFVIGSRQLLAVPRRLTTVSLSLEQLLDGALPPIAALPPGSDGYRFLSVPDAAVPQVVGQFPGHVLGGRQDYARRYIAMDGTFAEYLATFSGKTRSTLKRKRRKLDDLAQQAGGTVEIAEFTRPADLPQFFAEALPLSSQTYQARLLDAGLPDDPDFAAQAADLAEAGRLRAYVLRIAGTPAAYLYLPVDGDTLVYAYLGYAPQWAHASVGTVLQLEALERLFGEGRFRYFDFTEGDGAHKQMFSTGAAPASSFFLLRPTLANRALVGALAGFDGAVALGKRLAAKAGLAALARQALRR